MKAIVVIPARGKSKGIPKKNIRLMNGVPLIVYSLKNALYLKTICDTDVVVDTDDEEIAEIAVQYGATVVERPEELSGDEIPLDPVVFHAVQFFEKQKNIKYDIVVTMQATSPTLQETTLGQAFRKFLASEYDTMISAVNEPHLSWKVEMDRICPDYEERKNRQMLPPHLKETGGFLMTRRECVTEESRIGKQVTVYELPEKEAVDIDSGCDWALCESILKFKKIMLRADGEEELGMGHIYRCLSIAQHLTGHEIVFVTNRNKKLGREKIEQSFFHLELIDKDEDIFSIIDSFHPDIVVNDILNTSVGYMKKMRKKVPRIINFEDKGGGGAYADCVINALYQKSVGENVFCGFKYFFIRDEFLTARPKCFQEKVKNIVVLFGGSDPSNLTRKAYQALELISEKYPEVESHIITGFGYRYKNIIKDDREHRIYVHNDVKRVSKYLQDADLAITSQGRTIYELACMGVPSIVLAQNQRETEHFFANIANGFINLGIGKEQDLMTLRSTIDWLICTPNVRREMHELLMQKDFQQGQQRVLDLILGE